MTPTLEHRPELAYIELRTALDSFEKPLGKLDEAERRTVRARSARAYEIGARALASDQAPDVHVPRETLDHALAEIRGRYPDEAGFAAELEAHGFDLASFREALHRELRLEAVLDRVANRSAQVSDLDVKLFYYLHLERFQVPESRTVRQILITINPDYPENTRDQARQRLQALADDLTGDVEQFAAQASRHSECPSAMKGGLVGKVPRGTLFAALDEALFGMKAGQVSPIVETEMGLHVLLCEDIHAAHTTPLAEVEARIRGKLEKRRRSVCQREWLKSLEP
ncbi:nitrogen fixation protein NifM [Ectothiorhodospira variabilis]|uniref:nitrogen fixation protein NifM n=1 Tax=Ectothiorhodospira variabilis TaxID=505694 RepID=UPI001EFB5F08|nr:nitrogen fixation protein NifM [Ectothiorhodospira variabilis]MCG5495160.1 nitrogen fixation protein NifM [Ectothiorhodospira variabilis]MCG5503854.1 nitrogen fixation protein NifM [Ectothiorhodospira variabilis]MCG5507015.1 nitrogen fixation protein NifM [Ectothiorhodospira variabilis]